MFRTSQNSSVTPKRLLAALLLLMSRSTCLVVVQIVPPSDSRACSIPPLKAALGDLAAPDLPEIESTLIAAARVKLPWENVAADDIANSVGITWENGELWKNSRTRLVELWVLPRDICPMVPMVVMPRLQLEPNVKCWKKCLNC